MNVRILLLLCLASSLVKAQSGSLITLPTDENNQVQFQRVTQLDSVESAKSIISRIHTWVIKNYTSAATVVQQYDPDQGVLILKSLGTFNSPVSTYYSGKTTTNTVPYNLRYTLTIEAKPGRYRTTLNSLVLEPGAGMISVKNNKPVPKQAMSVETAYEAVKDIKLMSEKAKRANAELNVVNENSQLLGVQQHAEALFDALEKGLKQPQKKDW